MTAEEHTAARALTRRELVKLGLVAAGTATAAGCGVGETQSGESSAKASSHPPLDKEPGDLEVFEWAGFELPAFYRPYLREFEKKPKFTFLEQDDQALGKCLGGYRPDLCHPDIPWIPDWVKGDLIQPFDTSLITNFQSLNPSLVKAAQYQGVQYHIPTDWGFESLMYRRDKVDISEESWTLHYDPRYAGKISWFDDAVNLVIAGYVNGIDDPWNMPDAELNDMKSFLIEKKKVVRHFWSSQTNLDQDIASGNIWISFAWAGSWVNARKKKLDVVYMNPKEGRLSWTEGFVLLKGTKNYRHAHKYVDAWASPESAVFLVNEYGYGHTNTKVELKKLDPVLVKAFNLDDPTILDEPKTHPRRYQPRRQEYLKAWDEVKAA
jgi:spermidine/putrescine transport system substrate-binding protein